MNVYQWLMLGLGTLGFAGTWLLGAFYLGRAVEQIQASIKKYIDEELDKIIAKMDAMEDRFHADQRTQDHNFGEVGAAMRQFIADVEKKVREVEIYGRDHYVKIPDFEKAIDRIGETFAKAIDDLKEDMRAIMKGPSN